MNLTSWIVAGLLAAFLAGGLIKLIQPRSNWPSSPAADDPRPAVM